MWRSLRLVFDQFVIVLGISVFVLGISMLEARVGVVYLHFDRVID